MGEGWGDFFAICMTSQATDDFAKGVFAVGGWTDVTPSFKDNYYFSIRRYPYSADMAKNPLTFKHVSANVVLPVGPPRNPNRRPERGVPQCRRDLVLRALGGLRQSRGAHGHADAERRMLRYVIGGLKLTLRPRLSFRRVTPSSRRRARWNRPMSPDLEWVCQARHGQERQGAALDVDQSDGGRREFRCPIA